MHNLLVVLAILVPYPEQRGPAILADSNELVLVTTHQTPFQHSFVSLTVLLRAVSGIEANVPMDEWLDIRGGPAGGAVPFVRDGQRRHHPRPLGAHLGGD